MTWCCKHFRQLALGVVLTFLALWVTFVSLFPTGWLRDRVVAALQESLDRPVTLAEVRIGGLCGVRLVGLSIGDPNDPWLHVPEARLDTNLFAALCGHPTITRCEIDGARLRVRRLHDGSYEFGDIPTLARPPRDQRYPGRAHATAAEEPLRLVLTGASLSWIDDQSHTNVDFNNVDAELLIEDQRIELTSLSAAIADGRANLAGALVTTPGALALDGELRLHEIELTQQLSALSYILPLVAGARDELAGTLDLRVVFHADGPTFESLGDHIQGAGAVQAGNVYLANSALMEELGRVFPLPQAARTGSVDGTFTFDHTRVSTRDTTIRIGAIPITLAGSTAFDGTLDYTVRCADLSERLSTIAHRLPKKARALLDDLEARRSLERFRELRLTGTIDRIRLTPGPSAEQAILPSTRSLRR